MDNITSFEDSKAYKINKIKKNNDAIKDATTFSKFAASGFAVAALAAFALNYVSLQNYDTLITAENIAVNLLNAVVGGASYGTLIKNVNNICDLWEENMKLNASLNSKAR